MAERKDFIRNRTGVTYVDLFAGAGGFSEGFLQAFTDDKCYDFLLASDINRNCELTHIARYNRQLGLSTQPATADRITSRRRGDGGTELPVVQPGRHAKAIR